MEPVLYVLGLPHQNVYKTKREQIQMSIFINLATANI